VIIEIALGIVLAVIILALLPTILALGAVVVVVALAAALIIGAGLFFWHNPDFLVGLGILAGGLAILTGLGYLANRKWPHLAVDSIVGLRIAGVVGLVNYIVFSDFETYADYPVSVGVVVLADVALLFYFSRWNRSQLSEWRRKEALNASYCRDEA